MGSMTTSYHVHTGDHVEMHVQSPECMTLSLGKDAISHDVTLYARPAAMVELLSAALTHAQHLVELHDLHDDGSRQGPVARSLRSVMGAGAPAAPPDHLMAEGST